MSKENRLQQIYHSPLTQAALVVVDSVPIIGTGLAAGRKAAEQRHINILEQRKTVFFSELEKGGDITPEMIETEEFIHSVVVLYDAIIRTHKHEKIRRFARILLSAIEKNELASDKFEEYVKILESITEREVRILSLLRQLELKYITHLDKPYEGSKSSFKIAQSMESWAVDITFFVWDTFVGTVEEQCQITREELNSLLGRLEGMGLYSGTKAVKHEHSNRYNIGTTTVLFDDFSEWIKLENEKLSADG